MSRWGGSQIKYIPKENRNVTTTNENRAGEYSRRVMKSQVDRYEKGLDETFVKLLNDNATYIPNFFCKKDNLSLFNSLKDDMENCGEMVTWNKHFKHEDPTFSRTFQEIVKKMSDHFNVEVLATRLNYYKDGKDYKTFHKDSHAYSNGQKEDFTMGLALVEVVSWNSNMMIPRQSSHSHNIMETYSPSQVL